jgi:hypothetical protein
VTAQKPDASRIEAFRKALAASLSLDPLRSWWPNYLFHTTELRNAVGILDSGLLRSRADIGDDMSWDNANHEIIDHTPEWVKHRARLYFRPRTPMTYNNEGFRTPALRHPEAYCPLPVMLVFPSLPILTMTGVQFSDGNCASHETRFGSTAEFFESLPFADIYHDDRWPSEAEGRRIHRRKQAEVLVPSPFDIRSHKLQIRVRSAAERETLLTELRPAAADRYRSRIQVANTMPLFHKQWSYVESVSVADQLLTIRFNESTTDRNDFSIRLEFSTLEDKPILTREGSLPTVQPLRIPFAGDDLGQPFHLRIELDSRLAYSAVIDPRIQQIVSSRS